MPLLIKCCHFPLATKRKRNYVSPLQVCPTFRAFFSEKSLSEEMRWWAKVQYPFSTKWFTRRKTKILNCYYGIVGSIDLRDCFFFPGYALKCYQCFSYKSWDDCKDSTIQVNCSNNQNLCGKENVKGGILDLYAKGCANSSVCIPNCQKRNPSVKITKCEVDCCKGDLCNGAKVPMVSAIMLLSCAIVAFAR